MRYIETISACIIAVGVSGCGSDAPVGPDGMPIGTPTYPVNVKLLNGPTATAAGAYDGDRGRTVIVTPNSLTLTITNIALGHAGTPDMVQSATICQATFNRYVASNTVLSSCTLTFPAGRYDVVYLTVSRGVTVLLADTASGYYTTFTGSTIPPTSPSTGVPFATTTGSADVVVTIILPTKLVVDAATPATLGLVIDANHSVKVSQNSGENAMTVSQPLILATVGTPTSMEYYVRSPLRGAAAYCAQDCALPRALNGFTVVYTGANTPAAIAIHYFQIIECPFEATTAAITDPRSYMGLDGATSELTWALAKDDSWGTYAGLLQIKRLSTLGTSATLWCINRSSVSAPPGGTFSTAPSDMHTPGTDRGTFTLVAK